MIRFGYFGHDWSNGAAFGTWVNRYTTCVTAGEILAWRSPRQTAGNAVKQWLASRGHRAALLAKTWSVMGVELTQRNATVEFGRRRWNTRTSARLPGCTVVRSSPEASMRGPSEPNLATRPAGGPRRSSKARDKSERRWRRRADV